MKYEVDCPILYVNKFSKKVKVFSLASSEDMYRCAIEKNTLKVSVAYYNSPKETVDVPFTALVIVFDENVRITVDTSSMEWRVK